MGSNARSKFLGSAKEVVYFFFKYGSSIFFIFYFTLLGYNIRVKFISQWWGWSSPPFVFPWLGPPPLSDKKYIFIALRRDFGVSERDFFSSRCDLLMKPVLKLKYDPLKKWPLLDGWLMLQMS